MKLGDFDGGAALVQAHFRVGQAGRNHGYGAVVTKPEEGARGQKNLRFANLSLERLTRLQFGRTDRLAVERPPCDGGLAFDVIYASWARWVCAKSGPRQTATQEKRANTSNHPW